MAETLRNPRRWPWVVAGLLLAIFLIPVAWRFRPLNSVERRLVGDWLEVTDRDDLEALHFLPDRSCYQTGFMADPSRPGFRKQIREQRGDVTWTASGTMLTQRYDQPCDIEDIEDFLFALAVWISGGDRRSSEITFSGGDRVSIAGKTYERFDQRSPEIWRSRGPGDKPPDRQTPAPEAKMAPAP